MAVMLYASRVEYFHTRTSNGVGHLSMPMYKIGGIQKYSRTPQTYMDTVRAAIRRGGQD